MTAAVLTGIGGLTCNFSTCEVEARGPKLKLNQQSQCEDSMVDMRPCLNK